MRVRTYACATAWVLVVLAVSFATAVAPQRNGLLALAEVGAPFLFLSLLPVGLLAALRLPRSPSAMRPTGAMRATRARRWRAIFRASLLVALAFALVRFGPDWVSLPPSAAQGAEVGVTSWNLEAAESDTAAVIDQIRAAPLGFVGLVELGRSHAAAIGADDAVRTRFPYQLLFPDDGSVGIGLLSSYPVVNSGHVGEDPPIIWARLDLGEGRTLNVVEAHPLPAEWHTLGALPIPVDYDATTRDAQIVALRQIVDQLLANGQPLILAGDFNVTDREPAYADLSRGLLDAHLEVGLGPGSTWRPDPIKWLPLGILRIDMAFGGNGARPASMTADCTPRGSDHCLIRATMALP